MQTFVIIGMSVRIHYAYGPCGMFVENCCIIIMYFVFILEIDKRIQDTIPPTMESLYGVLESRKYLVVKQIGCGSCGKVLNV